MRQRAAPSGPPCPGGGGSRGPHRRGALGSAVGDGSGADGAPGQPEADLNGHGKQRGGDGQPDAHAPEPGGDRGLLLRPAKIAVEDHKLGANLGRLFYRCNQWRTSSGFPTTSKTPGRVLRGEDPHRARRGSQSIGSLHPRRLPARGDRPGAEPRPHCSDTRSRSSGSTQRTTTTRSPTPS